MHYSINSYIILVIEHWILDKYCKGVLTLMIPYYENDQRTFRHLNLYNFNFPPHLHSHIEIIYIEEGELYVTIDSTTKLMQKGDFAIAFPNRIHSYNTPKDGSCHITLAIFPV